MKTYMALDGLRWSRDSGSVHCNMPRSAVFGRSGGGYLRYLLIVVTGILLSYYLNKVNKHLLSLIFITSK